MQVQTSTPFAELNSLSNVLLDELCGICVDDFSGILRHCLSAFWLLPVRHSVDGIEHAFGIQSRKDENVIADIGFGEVKDNEISFAVHSDRVDAGEREAAFAS